MMAASRFFTSPLRMAEAETCKQVAALMTLVCLRLDLHGMQIHRATRGPGGVVCYRTDQFERMEVAPLRRRCGTGFSTLVFSSMTESTSSRVASCRSASILRSALCLARRARVNSSESCFASPLFKSSSSLSQPLSLFLFSLQM